MRPLNFALAVLLFGSVAVVPPVVAQCNPVVYLFRHAEDIDKDKQHPFDLTLATSGQAHAQLYIQMIDTHQHQNPEYCPVKVVYALNPRKPPTDIIGTSNPYWTANPLAQTVHTTLDEAALENTNAIITVQVGDQTLKLSELLNNGEGDKFLEDIKVSLNKQQSAAIFWTSDGMCAVAIKLGQPLPQMYDCVNNKPLRNSVFRFDYSVSEGQFTDVQESIQCFNYNATTNSFVDGIYYCKLARLDSYEQFTGFSNKLQKISGRICDKSNPQPPCTN